MSLARRTLALRLPLTPVVLGAAALAATVPALSAIGPSPPTASGDRVVRYHGVAVHVPGGWPVYDLARDPRRCVRLDVHAVYVGTPAGDENCPAHAVGRTEAVVIGPATGPSAASGADTAHVVTRLLARGQVRVTATYGARAALAHAVAQSAVSAPAPSLAPPRLTSPLRPVAYSAPAAGRAPVLAPPQATSTTSSTFIGNAFDTCNAPSLSAMKAWMASSPYRAANIYIGGADRACLNGNLSASWVSSARSMGWRLVPTYVGLQAPCTQYTAMSSDPGRAATQGRAAADDAANIAANLGLPSGSAVYFDMENYNRSASGCSAAVLAFLASWTSELHARGLLSGVYGSGTSVVADLVSRWGTGYPEPDDIWFADWDGLDSAYGDPYVPDSEWNPHRRIHQWHGGTTESYGGYSINIDGDGTDGQVAGPPGGDCVSYPVERYGPDGCDGAVTFSGPLQFWRFGSPIGWERSMRWTYGNGSVESNGATWAPPLKAGFYDLYVWVPGQHANARAHYTVNDTTGAHAVWVAQGSHAGSWVALGQFSTGLSGTINVHVGDDTSTSSVVGVDALEFHFLHPIDVQPPTGSITTPAAGSYARPGATVTVAGSFNDDVYVTRVDFSVADASGTWQPIGSDIHNGRGVYKVTWPESYPDGSVLSFKADIHDTANHITTVTAPNVLTVDGTPPTAAMTQPLWWFGTAATTPLAWTGSDNASGVASYNIRVQLSSPIGWTSGWQYPSRLHGRTDTRSWYGRLRAGWQYCFEARAVDVAGNLSRWSAPRCIARGVDDQSLVALTGGWWRPTGARGYYASTFTSTNRRGARLATPLSVAARRIALLATTCPKCGAVHLYVAGRYVGSLNLYAARWHTHQWVTVPAFAYRRGTLTMLVVTSGKLVRVDAVVVGR